MWNTADCEVRRKWPLREYGGIDGAEHFRKRFHKANGAAPKGTEQEPVGAAQLSQSDL